jgi:hypothetical protein
MRKLNKANISKYFVTVIFVLSQTVFLLLPSLVFNVYADWNESLVLGSLNVTYNDTMSSVNLDWTFPSETAEGVKLSYLDFRIYKSIYPASETLYSIDSQSETV